MTVYYPHIRALIDPSSRPARGGGRSKTSRRSSSTSPAAVSRSGSRSARQARELAFELLELAEHADRERTHP